MTHKRPAALEFVRTSNGRGILVAGRTAIILDRTGLAWLAGEIAAAMPMVPVKSALPDPADDAAYERVRRGFESGALKGEKRAGRWFGIGGEIAAYAEATARRVR